jgi:predicted nucleotidyltransferase
MHLTEAQFDILRAWAQHTAQVKEAYLFGSYVKGAALAGSDVDIAIRASVIDWTFRTAKWEEHLTKAIGIKVNIRTLELPNVRRSCDQYGVPLK